ncbi:hypothetical protein H3Z85_12375 [Chryseobacterium indologenes]|uniref:hypothetical protein n=1 Tax=Chryseobacterium indologenes TaxID=253 RepID=UPI0003E081BD|nr:hypothetical protein [Chryseobacterium indologenes]QPQ50312.1 hypothetical protein H3Z85_12375 [Chryseobacterium indologenes]SFK44963.1 hypothetical protein SAMN05421692_4398 [Chryseobacterium indologenes]SUX52929.1 Uncharacterised protein [Chryseobacterium indologenes]VFA43735.1 Uncharacterised protein [Chryseobacterium indologenes]GAE66952.1 hypothetical protein CIN01S_22_00030 [Chryseobacterium indologenes NBRC 14944]
METTNIDQILTLFRDNYNNHLYSIIYEYLDGLTVLKYILIDKSKAISIYTLRSEINSFNDSKISGYDELLKNLLDYNDKKVIISNFNYKNNDITIFISDKMDKVLGILNQKTN